MTDQRSKRDHRSKRDPQEGDTWCWGDNVSRNARGIKFKIIRVEEGFGGQSRAYYTGRTAGAISVDSLKWSADFMMEGPPPPKPVPSQAAIRVAAYLNGMASDWMRGVKEDWARGGREEEERKARELASGVSELPAVAHGIATKEEEEEYRLSLGPINVAELREKVKTFWQVHQPEKLHKLDECMERFKGNEHRLIFELKAGEAKMAKFGSIEAAQKAETGPPPPPTPA